MSTIAEFWQRVRQREAELSEKYPDGAMFIQPTNSKLNNTCGGLPAPATVAVAAIRLTEGTHVIASPEQIALYHARMAQNKAHGDAATLRNLGMTRLVLGQPK